MISRLATIAPDLVASLEHQQPRRLRLVAASGAGLAVERVCLSDPRLEAALGALREGRLGDTSERTGVQCLAREIDEMAWDAQERAEAGGGSREAYVIAFRKARAAAAVGFALEADALTAALEAVCEAHAAVKTCKHCVRSLSLPWESRGRWPTPLCVPAATSRVTGCLRRRLMIQCRSEPCRPHLCRQFLRRDDDLA